MSYIGKAPGVGVRNRYYFTATGGETSLSGADDASNTLAFSDGTYVDVALNGVILVAGTDYDTATANTIDNLTALSAGDVVEIVVYDVFSIASAVPVTGGTFSGPVIFNGELIVPRGTTADRPASPSAGSLRFNTSASAYEGYDGTAWVYLSDVTIAIEYLVIAGGGGGGAGFTVWAVGGGGGAGGAIPQTSSFALGTAYTVTVGAGGAAGYFTSSAADPWVPGGNGGNSVFHLSSAIGGGGGGAWQNAGIASNAKSGGSGGGSGNASGLRDPGTGAAGQGNDGGIGIAYTGGSTSGAGGGGGYSAAGGSATASNAGDGGAGLTSSISGASLIYAAGGGGGGTSTTAPGSGVSGVSGNGGNTQGGVLATAGTPNRGGGGGGGSSTNTTSYTGAAGGSGVVILKVPSGFSATFSAGVSQTSTTVGTDTIYTITAAGASDTVTFS